MALLVVASGWWLLLTNLDAGQQALERAALSEARQAARHYAEHMARVYNDIDQTLLHIRLEWQLSGGQLELESFRARKMLGGGPAVDVVIMDEHGQLLTSTVRQPTHRYFGDRPAFLAQKFAVIDVLYMGLPTYGRLTRRTVLHFSRGLSHADGSFAGVVLAAVTPEYLTTTYNETTLGRYGVLAIVGDDYQMRVSRIGERIYPPQASAFAVTPFFATISGSALFPGQGWFDDTRSRYIGWQQIEGTPLVAVAGFDQESALAPFLAMRQATIRNAALATLVLLAFATVATILSMRLAWRRHQLAMTQATYRMATEEGSDGFYIARAQRAKDGAITDFLIVDCNAHGARLFHQQRAAILGKTFSAALPGPGWEELGALMKMAMDHGYYEGELQTPPAWPGAPTWLHLKMVRADGELAIAMRDISESKAHVVELERRGNEDALTGLPNRHWLQVYLPQAIEAARGAGTMLALLFVDLDGFKKVNDTMGHQVGDELLRYAAERLKVAVRPDDHVVRLGGDEFVVIIEHLADNGDAAHVAQRVVSAFSEKFRLSQGTHAIGTSIGISVYPTDGTDAASLLQNADIAMYSAKTAGKGRYSFYEKKFYDALRARLELERELRRAVENDEFVLYYQPRIDIDSGVMSSMEALVRWRHPTRGLLEPAQFIGLAEESGLIIGIGHRVLEHVCAQLAAWSAQSGPLVPVSLNVSLRQFHHESFAGTVMRCLQRYRVDPHWLEIEVTESCMMQESAEVSAALKALRGEGIKFSIDDFGTGYSSLSQLQQLDFDVLKVDRAFTSKVEKTEEGKVFFTAIITMAHALGMRVVAEGVENARQLDVLKALRCDEIQGFYVSRPVPPAERQPELERNPAVEAA